MRWVGAGIRRSWSGFRVGLLNVRVLLVGGVGVGIGAGGGAGGLGDGGFCRGLLGWGMEMGDWSSAQVR